MVLVDSNSSQQVFPNNHPTPQIMAFGSTKASLRVRITKSDRNPDPNNPRHSFRGQWCVGCPGHTARKNLPRIFCIAFLFSTTRRGPKAPVWVLIFVFAYASIKETIDGSIMPLCQPAGGAKTFQHRELPAS